MGVFMQLLAAMDAFFLSMQGVLSPATILFYRNHLKYLGEFLGNCDLNSITITQLRAWRVTLVERHSRFVMLIGLPDNHTADVVADALSAKIAELPAQLRRSLTWDQGTEMARHARFTVATGVPVYFCDPHSPWQRGSNENTNGLLRQYFPKGKPLPRDQAALDAVADELNGRPRQTLGWKTPSQALDQALR